MSKVNCRGFVISLIFFSSLIVSAQYGEAPPATAAGSSAGPQEKEFSGQQSEKWIAVQKSLVDLKTKVDAQKKIVAELLKSKKSDEAKISQEEIALLKNEHERLQSLTNSYNEMLANFQFRFPEKGLELGRKYIRIESQTIEEMENAPTIQGRLKKLNKKIKKQYQDESVAEQTGSHKSPHKNQKTPVGSKVTDTEKSNNSDVTEQIILVK
jgi:hypothetical protein